MTSAAFNLYIAPLTALTYPTFPFFISVNLLSIKYI